MTKYDALINVMFVLMALGLFVLFGLAFSYVAARWLEPTIDRLHERGERDRKVER